MNFKRYRKARSHIRHWKETEPHLIHHDGVAAEGGVECVRKDTCGVQLHHGGLGVGTEAVQHVAPGLRWGEKRTPPLRNCHLSSQRQRWVTGAYNNSRGVRIRGLPVHLEILKKEVFAFLWSKF